MSWSLKKSFKFIYVDLIIVLSELGFIKLALAFIEYEKNYLGENVINFLMYKVNVFMVLLLLHITVKMLSKIV